MIHNTEVETPITLKQDNLGKINAGGIVATPSYDRDKLVAGIIHFGVGGFHRAHQAMVIDRLLAAGLANDYAICGVGVLEQDRRMADIMAEQDHLYTLVLKHADGTREARVIGSIIDYLFAPDDPEKVIERMASPEVKIVSLTVTEGGYNFDQVTGDFLADEPQIRRDVENPERPATVFGFVYAALQRRRERNLSPFTVMSCDNIQGNGAVAKASFTAFVRLIDPAFADWMEKNVRFPNSMVDRITPVTTEDDRKDVENRLGVHDQWPVVAEPWCQWVLEDNFNGERPPFDQGGVQLVDDVEPWEIMKLRLANVGHQTICYFGTLLGYTYAHEAASDADITRLLEAYIELEAIPTLHIVPGLGLDEFRSALLPRFRNPEIKDTLARLRAESSDRIPKWLLPVVRENLKAGRGVSLGAAISASWARYAEGVGEKGEQFTIVDRLKDELMALAATQRNDPTAFIQNRTLFGNLASVDAFRDPYLATLQTLWTEGARLTLQKLV
ncbi:mannitol dehydrogenase family protein [Arthrobacter sp. Soil736]|uniref:mannitol dehydrogenase family protein n=1 Tax=Arthrobacter sp. Soil736 TaxID=1736395 RepID=UPI0009E9306B|nr:mannitol dehydrogenase family protein [Arthrobacter sp. Soil736]